MIQDPIIRICNKPDTGTKNKKSNQPGKTKDPTRISDLLNKHPTNDFIVIDKSAPPLMQPKGSHPLRHKPVQP